MKMSVKNTRRSIARLCGSAALLFMALILMGSGAAYAALVPYRMDSSNQAGWWKPLDEFNGYTYMVYDAWGDANSGGAEDTHTIYIAKRAPNGTWTRGALLDADGNPAVYPDDVGHRQPTIAVDGDGYIHAFAAMHQNNWRYWRSAAPGDVTNMVWQGRTMPDQADTYTYPVAARISNGDVYLMVRAVTSGRLYRWNNAANSWSRVATVGAQSGYSFYPDDVIGDDAGNVHISWEWAYGAAGGLRHLASYLRYSPSANRFYNAAGTQITTPTTTATSSVVYQPIEGTERLSGVGSLEPGVQSAKLAVNPATNQPFAAYRYKTTSGGKWTVRLAEWNGSTWQRSVVYAGSYDTFAAVDVSTYGTGLRVYYAKIGTPGGNHAHGATRQANGTWVETVVLAQQPVERLSVIRRGAVDYLYLAAPSTQELHYGTFPW